MQTVDIARRLSCPTSFNLSQKLTQWFKGTDEMIQVDGAKEVHNASEACCGGPHLLLRREYILGAGEAEAERKEPARCCCADYEDTVLSHLQDHPGGHGTAESRQVHRSLCGTREKNLLLPVCHVPRRERRWKGRGGSDADTMPGLEKVLGEKQKWDLINFLRATGGRVPEKSTVPETE